MCIFASQWDIPEKSISIELSFSNISFIAMSPPGALSIYLRQWGYEVCGQRIYQAMINQCNKC